MLYTLKSPGKEDVTTDCPREAFKELLKRRPTVRIFIGSPPLEAELDLGQIFRCNPDDAASCRAKAYRRFTAAVSTAEFYLLIEAMKCDPTEEWFAKLEPYDRAGAALDFELAVSFVYDFLAPVLSRGTKHLGLFDEDRIAAWGLQLSLRCWNWLAEAARHDPVLDKLIIEAIRDPNRVVDLGHRAEQYAARQQAPASSAEACGASSRSGP